MKELGEDSLKEHQAIVNLIEKNKFTRVYLVGNEFALTDHLPYLSFSTIEEVSQHITKEKIENAVILIKGSRSMQMERIVDYI
jgi:UDP-N-acetylmuramoyl-tripeptide--D-alanyl-D-alanine ligase